VKPTPQAQPEQDESPPIGESAQPASSHYFSHQGEVVEAAVGKPVRGTRRVAVHAAGHHLVLTSGAGVFARDRFDPGSALLVETFIARVTAGPAVAGPEPRVPEGPLLDLGCGWGGVGCLLAAHYPQLKVALCDINLPACRLARHNAAENALLNTTVWCGNGCDAAKPGLFAHVLCNPPVRAGNAAIAHLFSGARKSLHRGCKQWIVLRTAQGAKSWIKRLQGEWGNCETLAIEAGYRVLCSEKV
jgi:16S rRNA (guanine1207-N2)-methyltransferase